MTKKRKNKKSDCTGDNLTYKIKKNLKILADTENRYIIKIHVLQKRRKN